LVSENTIETPNGKAVVHEAPNRNHVQIDRNVLVEAV
jgi:hypothetical protein